MVLGFVFFFISKIKKIYQSEISIRKQLKVRNSFLQSFKSLLTFGKYFAIYRYPESSSSEM